MTRLDVWGAVFAAGVFVIAWAFTSLMGYPDATRIATISAAWWFAAWMMRGSVE